MQVNDAVLAGDNTLVSCSSDTTLKVCQFESIIVGFLTYGKSDYFYWLISLIEIHQTWNCLSDGTCTRTLRQHSDYVTCLAAAEKNVISLSKFSWNYLLHRWRVLVSVMLLFKFHVQFNGAYLGALCHILSLSFSDPFIVSCILEQCCCLWWPWWGGFCMGSGSCTNSSLKVKWCNGGGLFQWHQWFWKFIAHYKSTDY